jgi:hypothetical protein
VFYLTGSNFVNGITVSFDGVQASSVSLISSSQLSGITPSGPAGLATVTVQNVDGQTASLFTAFTYVPPPVITSVSPSTGPTIGGNTVTISGSGFQSGATVLFGSTTAAVTFINSSTLSVVAPAGTGTINISIDNPDGQNTTALLVYSYALLFKISGRAKIASGQALAGAQIMIIDQSTNLPATLYDSAAETNLLSQPLTTDGNGKYVAYVQSGTYTINITQGSTTLSFIDQNIGVGQSGLIRKDLWFTDCLGRALAGASVFVCQEPANTLPPADTVGWQPTPQQPLFDSDGNALTQPLAADQYGHLSFYIPAGQYTVVAVFGSKVIFENQNLLVQ